MSEPSDESKPGEVAKLTGDAYWAYNFYVLGAMPAMLALFTSTSANLIYFTQPSSSQCDWFPVFLRADAYASYYFLFIYAWMMVGPIPFRKALGMKVLKYMMFSAFVAACGANGFGMWVVTSYSQCGRTMGSRDGILFYSSVVLMGLFFAFFMCTMLYFLSGYVSQRSKKGRQSRMKALEARVRKQMEMEGVDGDSDEDEDEGGSGKEKAE